MKLCEVVDTNPKIVDERGILSSDKKLKPRVAEQIQPQQEITM